MSTYKFVILHIRRSGWWGLAAVFSCVLCRGILGKRIFQSLGERQNIVARLEIVVGFIARILFQLSVLSQILTYSSRHLLGGIVANGGA